MNISIIGCGNIGTALAMFLEKHAEVNLIVLADADGNAACSLQKKLSVHHPEVMELSEAITAADLIVEAASPAAVKEILKHLAHLNQKKKLLVISTGGLISKSNAEKINEHAEIFFPSGAIAGLDAIKAVAGKIDSLELITTKPSAGLQQATYVQNQKLDISSIKKPWTVFEGNIFDAVKYFPQNINVAASLFLASKFKKIHVSIIADPKAKLNRHEIICKGKFGTIHTVTENVPSSNPKTSYLALLSAQYTLLQILNTNTTS